MIRGWYAGIQGNIPKLEYTLLPGAEHSAVIGAGIHGERGPSRPTMGDGFPPKVVTSEGGGGHAPEFLEYM